MDGLLDDGFQQMRGNVAAHRLGIDVHEMDRSVFQQIECNHANARAFAAPGAFPAHFPAAAGAGNDNAPERVFRKPGTELAALLLRPQSLGFAGEKEEIRPACT
jgi:hypothetical protein